MSATGRSEVRITQVFGRWRVYGPTTDPRYWECRCACGTLRNVRKDHLRSGATQSCGCLAREATRARSLRHGANRRNGRTTEYEIWAGMKTRCGNPASKLYPYYGGRGIFVCERWSDNFANFLADMGPRPSSKHSIDRIDNDGPYAPQNCRWVSRKTQVRNRRNTFMVTIDGATKPLAEWAEIVGQPYKKLWQRIRYSGWNVKKAVFTP